jgi:hypothetical protein
MDGWAGEETIVVGQEGIAEPLEKLGQTWRAKALKNQKNWGEHDA